MPSFTIPGSGTSEPSWKSTPQHVVPLMGVWIIAGLIPKTGIVFTFSHCSFPHMAFLQHQHMNIAVTLEFILRKNPNYHTFGMIFSFYWKTLFENKIEATRQTKLSWASFRCCKSMDLSLLSVSSWDLYIKENMTICCLVFLYVNTLG